MSFFQNMIGTFKDAVKAGGDFNPVLEGLLGKLEDLHAQGKLNDVIYQAEQAYVAEHKAYKEKGVHTDAKGAQNDLQALNHFMTALESHKDALGPELKEDVEKLLNLKGQMENILGKFMK